MKKMKQRESVNWVRVITFFVIGIVVGLVILVAGARLAWHSKFYPGVSVAGVHVGGLPRQLAKTKLETSLAEYQATLTFNGSSWVTPKDTFVFDVDASLDSAYRYGRRLQIGDYLFLLINRQVEYSLKVESLAENNGLQDMWREIWPVIEIPSIEPTVEIKNNKIVITNGSSGVVVDQDKLLATLETKAQNLDATSTEIPTKVAGSQLGSAQLSDLQTRGEKLLPDTLILQLDDTKIVQGAKELVAFLDTSGSDNPVKIAAVHEYVQGLANSLNQEPQDAKFVFENGKVNEFAPGKDGVAVQVDQTTDEIVKGIVKLLTEDAKAETVQIVADQTPPRVTTDKVNNLGIRERIGRGESYYAHSIANRVFNVGLAASRINSALIPPGGTFSFDQIIGEITAATGYKTAYVIQNGRTELGDGGGVCQVSTTMFRAAMAAGLPITERSAHAYRVGYYEQNSKPGIDATVFSPSKDLKFQNDTPGYILVQTINDPKNLHLIIDIYGTSDGRVATVSEPKVWGITPPPPGIVQEDPTIASGTTKQVGWSAWGAKTSFVYNVVRNGETLQNVTFNSNYKPWANIYLKGTAI